MNRLYNSLSKKVELTHHEELKKVVNALPQMSDLKELYNKVVPPLSEFEKSMAEYATAHKKFEQIILRTDEVLLDKASKVSVKEVR